ncbi:hypothetical protein HPP92_024344 [Vanilla planifolia]|uniref:Cytochrome P450 n=1 Tax=Vanilla planifolia TaxID=51239 RepID=A0A835PQJ8_VANPL|nr:hypothetical protein HPP92_024344 [Vanilla planifolia]
MEMELAWLPSPTQNLVMFFFLALLLKRIYDARSYRGPKPKLPPGPWRMPFIGSIHQLILSGEQTHHRFHSLAKKFGPLFHIKLGQVDFVVASSPTAARAVLNTNDHLLASRPNLLAVETIGYNSTGIGFSPYGPYWRQLRKICSQELLSVQKRRRGAENGPRDSHGEGVVAGESDGDVPVAEQQADHEGCVRNGV